VTGRYGFLFETNLKINDMETENKIIFVMALLMAIGSGVGMFYNYSLVLFFACSLSLLYAIHKEERK
jgi:hypothetical protein